MESGGSSRTAVFVCQGRAVADGRIAVGTFSDPVAELMLDDEEREPVRRARSGEPSRGRERYTVESMLACAEVVAPRTVLIDDAVAAALAARPGSQVVLLGAGLDSRAWRLPCLEGVPVFSLDHPASAADALRRQASLPAPLADLRRVAVDLAREPLVPALSAAGHVASRPTVTVWEGVIPYLTPGAVAGTVSGLAAMSAPGSVLVAQYQDRWRSAHLARHLSGLLAKMSGVASPLADEPWRSTWTPTALHDLLHAHGWSVERDSTLLEEAERIGSPNARARSLANGHVAVARR
jgi:methyltransferase (TIGR00027 family)